MAYHNEPLTLVESNGDLVSLSNSQHDLAGPIGSYIQKVGCNALSLFRFSYADPGDIQQIPVHTTEQVAGDGPPSFNAGRYPTGTQFDFFTKCSFVETVFE